MHLMKKCWNSNLYEVKKAFGNECMSKTRIKEWYNRFKGDRTSVDSDSRSGRPWTTKILDNIKRVRLAIEGDRRLTVRELENDHGIPKTTVREILNKILGMTRVCAVTSFFTIIKRQRIHRIFDNLRTVPTKPPVTFVCFQNSKNHSKDSDSMSKRRLKIMRRAYSRPSLKVSSRTVSRSGNIAVTVLFNQVRITLKDATRPMMKNNASAEI